MNPGRRIALLFAFFVGLVARPSLAHDLAMDQLTLWVDHGGGVLHGQLTFSPHLTRKDKTDDASPIEIGRRVTSAVSDNVAIEIDGKPCKLALEVRELWVPAGATLGDIVMLRCPLPREAHELRVHAGQAIKALIVSVDAAGAGAAGPPGATRSVLVEGGGVTPAYRFAEESADWQVGGATQFEPGGSSAPRATDAGGDVPEPSGARRGTSSEGFADVGLMAQAKRYLALGVHHILPLGWDHALFVAGLVLGTGLLLRPLILQLSAFTLAHTITLALGALGLVVLPRGIVEPMIAFSIAYVAVENFFANVDRRRRLVVVFLFGLLHGQGFAGALAETGLPRSAFVVALLSFNVGVEVGQLVVVLILAAGLLLLRRAGLDPRRIVLPLSAAIACMGIYWGVARLLG